MRNFLTASGRVTAAVVLAVVLAISGCTGGQTGGTISVTSPRSAAVDAMWFATGPEGPYGGTSRTKFTVEPNAENDLRVGISETESGATGPMWRAAAWMAVVMSGLLTGTDINKYKFTVDTSGLIDGPSAGGLFTVTILSLLLGDSVRPDAAMTGTINPDGTIGPIGGIPQKLEGAKKANKKLVLIPLGQRYDFDEKTGETVDTVERGQRLGIEVREVGDIYEAYEAMTGKKLPKPQGAADEPPALPSAAFEKVKSKAKEWQSRFEQERGDFQGMEPRYRQPFARVAGQATAAAGRSQSYFTQGVMASAFAKALEATLLMTIATEGARLVNIYLTQGPQAALERLKSKRAVTTRLDGVIDRLKAEKPKNATEALVLADAYGYLTIGLGLVDLAENLLAQKPQSEEQKQEFIFTAALYHALANHVAQLASDVLDIGMGVGSGSAPETTRLQHFAEILRRAAEANLTYFDAVVINERAKARGVHPDAVKQSLRAEDFDYTFAVATINIVPYLKDRLGGGDPAAYATLGGALASYIFSSAVVAKYYSLGAQQDKAGNLVAVRRERAMIRMLDFAEKRTRELIALAKKTGNEPAQPIVYYEDGKIDREGNVAEKFSGLESFWQASLQAELMTIFSGKYVLAR